MALTSGNNAKENEPIDLLSLGKQDFLSHISKIHKDAINSKYEECEIIRLKYNSNISPVLLETQYKIISSLSIQIHPIPNTILRSALFAVSKRGQRKLFNDKKIVSWKGTTIIYSGESLDQSDLKVWMHLVKSVLPQLFKPGDDSPLYWASSLDMLKNIRKTSGGKGDREWLTRSLNRLTKNNIHIDDGKEVYNGGLILKSTHNKYKDTWEIRISRKLGNLFSHNYWTGIDKACRDLLHGQLTMWAMAFFKSHRGPTFRINLTKLLALSGSASHLKKFRLQLDRNVLPELEKYKIIKDHIIVRTSKKRETLEYLLTITYP
ncbi:MAG: hypothetical protein AB1633_11680 [Elusimicrobiota bacterium]